MKVLILVKPSSPAPMEMLPGMLQGFAAWRQQWKPIMEAFYFFATNQGGCGIVNAPDESTLHACLASFPYAPFSTVEALPIVDGDEALARFTSIVGEMMSAMQG